MKIQNMLYLSKKVSINIWKIKNIVKLEIIVITAKYRSTGHNIHNLELSLPTKIPILLYNGSKHDYIFFIKELVEEFKRQFTCLGENIEKYITFTNPIEKEVTRTDKNREKLTKHYML